MQYAPSDCGMEFTFRHQFDNDDENILTYFAFTYPWSIEENNNFLRDLEIDCKSDETIYFNRSNLIMSREGRNIDMITISSLKGIDV